MHDKEAKAFIRNKQGDMVFFYGIRDLRRLFPPKYHLQNEEGETRRDAVQFVVEGVVSGLKMSSRIDLESQDLPADLR